MLWQANINVCPFCNLLVRLSWGLQRCLVCVFATIWWFYGSKYWTITNGGRPKVCGYELYLYSAGSFNGPVSVILCHGDLVLKKECWTRAKAWKTMLKSLQIQSFIFGLRHTCFVVLELSFFIKRVATNYFSLRLPTNMERENYKNHQWYWNWSNSNARKAFKFLLGVLHFLGAFITLATSRVELAIT